MVVLEIINARTSQLGGTAAEWTAQNPKLYLNEFGVEEDTHKFKIGDGVHLWNDLDYGIPGVPGSQGAQGAQGTTGGPQGFQGNQGTQGAQGTTGAGSQGSQGNQGAPGTGSQGSQGSPGSQGSQGSQGAAGIAAVTTITAAETVQASENGGLVRVNIASGAGTLTLPGTGASMATGWSATYQWVGTIQPAFAAGSGASITNNAVGLKVAASGQAVTAICIAANTYTLIGALAA